MTPVTNSSRSRTSSTWRAVAVCLAVLVAATNIVGCGSASDNLQTMSYLYGMSPSPAGQIGSLLLAAAADQVRREERNQVWATCPGCGTYGWWPRDALRSHQGRTFCNSCGCRFVFAAY